MKSQFSESVARALAAATDEERESMALRALREVLKHLTAARYRFITMDTCQSYRIRELDLRATGLADTGSVNVFLSPVAPGEDS